MNILQLVMGAMLLLLGRRLFWLSVGILGFLFGFDWVSYQMVGWPLWSAWLVAVALGAICAVGAIFLQRIFFGIAGFLAGGYLLVMILVTLGVQNTPTPGVFFVVGGVIGAVLAMLSVDWVLVTLTSLVGAAIVTDGFGAGPNISGLIFVGLVVVGIAVQIAALRSKFGTLPTSRRS